ncbi:MAG TPA: efflux RND transporter periplasmic adaptor subunit [Bacteroidales bacterium]|nr:efflux RND transporter periplasmic adaptor subunit [Bacteroidales bacterium]
MKSRLYLLLAAIIISGCGESGEVKDGMPQGDAVINRSAVNVTHIAGIGKVEPENGIIYLAAITGGIVKEIYRKDGEAIRKDEPLLRLDDELEIIRAEQAGKQVQAQKIQKGVAELAVSEAEERLNNRSRLLASAKALVEKGAETTQNLDDLDTEVKTLTIALERSRSELSLSLLRVEELSAQLKLAGTELARKTIRSPFDGLLLEMLVKEGASLNQYDDFAVFAPEGRTIITAEVDELFADRLTEGLSAEIRFIGNENAIATGSVIFVSPYLKNKSLFSKKPAEQEDRLVREVKILIDNNPGLIYNSKVECIIKL